MRTIYIMALVCAYLVLPVMAAIYFTGRKNRRSYRPKFINRRAMHTLIASQSGNYDRSEPVPSNVVPIRPGIQLPAKYRSGLTR